MNQRVRTHDGFKTSAPAPVGQQSHNAAAGAAVDVEPVAFVTLDNSGGAATMVATLPSARELCGRGMVSWVIIAAANPADVQLVAQAGETIAGAGSQTFASNANLLAVAESPTSIIYRQL